MSYRQSPFLLPGTSVKSQFPPHLSLLTPALISALWRENGNRLAKRAGERGGHSVRNRESPTGLTDCSPFSVPCFHSYPRIPEPCHNDALSYHIPGSTMRVIPTSLTLFSSASSPLFSCNHLPARPCKRKVTPSVPIHHPCTSLKSTQSVNRTECCDIPLYASVCFTTRGKYYKERGKCKT